MIRCTTEILVLMSIRGCETELKADVRFTYLPPFRGRGPTWDCGGEPPEPEDFVDIEVVALRDDKGRLFMPGWLCDWIAKNIDDDDLRDAVPNGPDPDEAYERKREARWDPWAAE